MNAFWQQIFVHNWQRKLASLVLASLIWFGMNYSLTVTKVIPNIPVRVKNLSAEKTIEGMQINGLLKKHVSLTMMGHKSDLDNLKAKNLEIVIDAKDKPQEWIATITEKNLVCLDSSWDALNLKVTPFEMIIRQSKLITEKIPILVTEPMGEAPKGYQFLDIWPYQMSLTVSGPEETVKRIKNRGLKLTFNLNDISAADLDSLAQENDEITFFVPDFWKKIALPQISDESLEIDDPMADNLRIDFSRQDLLPIDFQMPMSVFFPPKYSHMVNPQNCSLGTNQYVVKKDGIYLLNATLFAQGVSQLFLDIVKDMMHVAIVVVPRSESDSLLWNVNFLYPHELEDRYVRLAMMESKDEIPPHLEEDLLRNRFRGYMNRFRLYTPNNEKLSMKVELQGKSIVVIPQNYQ